jgi:hypothetical protein
MRSAPALTLALVACAPAAYAQTAPARDDEGANEAVVRRVRPAREATRRTVDAHEVQRIPGTNGDALRAIQNMPGVARPPFATGLIVVRGAAPEDTAIFAEGGEIPLVYHFGGLTSVFPSDLLERIDFYPGNFAARYGRVSAGAIDVGLRSPRGDRFHAMAQASVIDAGFRIEGPIARNLTFLVAARRSYLDATLGLVSDLLPFASIKLPVYWDWQAIVEWRPTARDRVRLLGFGSDDSLAFLFTEPQDVDPTLSGRVDTGLWFHRAQAVWEHQFAGGSSLRAMLSAGRDVNDVQFARVASLRVDRAPVNARVEYARTIAPGTRWNVGLDLAAGPARFTFRGPRPPGLGSGVVTSTADLEPVATDASGTVLRPALWTDLELSPSPDVRFVPSLRVDYFNDIGRVTVSPRVAFRVRPAARWWVKGGVGLFMQPPQFQQTLDAPNLASTSNQRVGNPNLAPQRALHYSLGFEHDFSSVISLSAEGFVRTVDDLVAQSGDPSARVPYTNAGASRAYGMELLLRHRATSRFFGWIAYTLSRTVIRARPDQPYDLTDLDQTHILTAVGSVNLGRGWTVGARFRYVTGTPNAALTGAFFNADTLVYVPVYEAVTSQRITDFHQLDLRVDKTWTWSRASLTLFLDVMNVYNRANAEGSADSFDYRQRGLTTGLPIVPSLGLRGDI